MPMREPTKGTRYTSKLTQWYPPVTTPILCYKQVLCQSLFKKALLRRPVASADTHMIMVNALPMGLHAASVARRTTRLSNVEGRRHSLSGWSPSLRRSQKQRQQRFSGKLFNRGRGWEEGESNGNKKSTPNKPGAGWGHGSKPHKTFSLTVADILSGPPHPPKVTGLATEVVSIKADLSRPAHPPKTAGDQCINTFMCDALRGNGNEEYSLTSNIGKAYTDTDSDGKSEIITDITCKFQGKLIAMEVQVDPVSETNCIPLSHFRCLSSQLCREDGNLRENTLEPTLAQFEAYDGGILQAHGWITLPTQDIKDKKSHHVRYDVVDREEARILISHATATWKVLCPNKAPKIKRHVASASKKAKKSSDQNNNNFLSGLQHPPKVKYFIAAPQHPPKEKYSQMAMVKQQQDESPTSQPHSHRRRHCRGKPVHRGGVDG